MKHEKEKIYQKLYEVRVEIAKQFEKAGLDGKVSDYLATKYMLINETAISSYLLVEEQADVGKIIERISDVEAVSAKR